MECHDWYVQCGSTVRFCYHWKKRNEDKLGGGGKNKDDEGLEDEDMGMMMLPGEDNFMNIMLQAWIEGVEEDESVPNRDDCGNDVSDGGKGESNNIKDDKKALILTMGTPGRANAATTAVILKIRR